MGLVISSQAHWEHPFRSFVINMDKEIQDRLNRIKDGIGSTAENMNGDHSRSIKEIDKHQLDLDEVKGQLKKDQKYQKRFKNVKLTMFLFIGLGLILFGGAYFNYNINGNTELSVKENEVMVGNNIDGTNDYFRFDITNSTPSLADCNSTNDYGRSIVLINSSMPPINRFYLCTNDGWEYTNLI